MIRFLSALIDLPSPHQLPFASVCCFHCTSRLEDANMNHRNIQNMTNRICVFYWNIDINTEWQKSGQSGIWTNLLCLCQLEKCPRGTQAKPRWHLSVNTISKTNVHHSQDTVTHVHSLHRTRSHICEKSRANSLSHAHSPAHWHTERLNTICSLCAFPVVLCCALCNIYVLCAIYMYFVLIALDIPCCARAHCFCVWTVQNMHFVLIYAWHPLLMWPPASANSSCFKLVFLWLKVPAVAQIYARQHALTEVCFKIQTVSNV